MEDLCKQEVIRIHAFFVDWLNGRPCRNGVDHDKLDKDWFERDCASVLANDLIMIKTNGRVLGRTELEAELKGARGLYNQQQGQGQGPEESSPITTTSNSSNMTCSSLQFDMEIHDFQVVQRYEDDCCLVMYQEWHYHCDEATKSSCSSRLVVTDKRQCTALLRRCKQEHKTSTQTGSDRAPCNVKWVHIHETSIE